MLFTISNLLFIDLDDVNSDDSDEVITQAACHKVKVFAKKSVKPSKIRKSRSKCKGRRSYTDKLAYVPLNVASILRQQVPTRKGGCKTTEYNLAYNNMKTFCRGKKKLLKGCFHKKIVASKHALNKIRKCK